MSTQKRAGMGCLTAFIVMIVLLIGIPLFLVWMFLPGQSQWSRLQMTETQNASFEREGNMLRFEEDWIEQQINQGILELTADNGDFEYAGSELRLTTQELNFITGVILKNTDSIPFLKGKDLRLTAELFLNMRMIDSETLEMKLKKIKIGKMPIPIALIMKAQALQDSLNPEELFKSRGASLNMKDQTIVVSLNEVLESFNPGSSVNQLALTEGAMILSLSLSDEMSAEIQQMAVAYSGSVKELQGTIQKELPAEKTEILNQAVEMLEELSIENPDETAMVTYMEGELTAHMNGESESLDIGSSVQNGMTIVSAEDSYAEIALPGASVLKILENTEVMLSYAGSQVKGADNEIKLVEGKLRTVVSKLDHEEDIYQIHAGTTTMGVRGTDFTVEYSEEKVTLSVLEGTVAIKDKERNFKEQFIERQQRVVSKPQGLSEIEEIPEKEIEQINQEIPMYTSLEQAAAGLKFTPLPVLIAMADVYRAFWYSLSQDEQEKLQIVLEDYVEEHPEMIEGLEDFLEEQGITGFTTAE